MKTLLRYLLPSSLAWILITGCTHTSPPGARLNKSDAVRLAKQAAEQEGIILSDYKAPEARYQSDGSWFVFFDGRGFFRSVGSHFAVAVDDRTGEARVSPGK
jgi:hypothetical protein